MRGSSKMAQVKGGKFHKKSKNRANKVHLVFDEAKRREFLTGFHKRKLQRKKQAKEKLENELKEERKRLKQEAKESYKNLVVSYRPIPELEEFAADEYEDDEVKVQVVELSANDIANQNNWIGPNRPRDETDEESGDDEEEENSKDEVPGMELKRKPVRKVEKATTFNSERDVKRLLKKQATKNVQKSKAFQTKNKLERQKQRKKSMQQKRERVKFRTKQEKKKRRG